MIKPPTDFGLYYSIVFTFAFAVSGVAGCGAGGEGPPVHPVAGTLRVDGAPGAGAEVVFHPVGRLPAGTPPPTAVVDAEGGFRPSTRLANDGAPAGDYVLTVVRRKPAGLADDDGGSAVDLLRGRYSDPRTSPLKVTVEPGDNVLPPIELSAKKNAKR